MAAEFRFPRPLTRETGTISGHTLETIKERVKYLYDYLAFTDVNLWIRDSGSDYTIPAHKAILSVGSPIFAKIFFKDKDRKTSPSEVEVKNVDLHAFQKLVGFLYTDEVIFEDEDDVIKVYVVAEKFRVPRLEEKCKKLFSTVSISSDTACQTLQQSISLNIECLKERCLNYIAKNTTNVLRSSSFEKADLNTILTILELQELSMKSECEVLNAATTWALKRNPNLLGENKWDIARQFMEPLLPHIRFLAMSTSEFTDFLNRCKGLFTEGEALAIIMGISNKSLSLSNFPGWCNRSKSRCVKQQRSSMSHNQSVPSVARPQELQEEIVTLTLGLKKSRYPPVDSLRSILEVSCVRDSFTVTGVKLKWKKDESVECIQSRLTYYVVALVQPSGFRVTEEVRYVCDQEEATVNFSKIIYFGGGDRLILEVVVKEVEGFRFLTYSPKKRKNEQDLPFVCTLDCVPQKSNFSLFKELYFQKMQYYPRGKGKSKVNLSENTAVTFW